MIDPADGDAEPAVGADLLATEAEDEVTIGIATEGQSDIHEADMLITGSMGSLDGGPHGDGIRMEWGIALAARGGIPEVGITIAEDGDRGSDDVFMVFGNQYLAQTSLHHVTEESIVGDVALGLEPVVMVQQFREGFELGKGLYGFGHSATLLGVDNSLQLLIADALFRCAGVQ